MSPKMSPKASAKPPKPSGPPPPPPMLGSTHAVNVGGMLNVLVAATDAKVKRLIYSASSAAYGDSTKFPSKEGDPINPQSPYGLHKYVGELYCRLWSAVYGVPTAYF